MWFDGPITEAITKSKASQSLLIVFIRHASETEESKSMDGFWADEEIQSRCEQANVIALKLIENGESAKQFADVYPVPIVPCSFLISLKGIPLEVITMCTELDRDAFSAKIRDAIQIHQEKVDETVENLQQTNSSSVDEKVERAKKLLAAKKTADEEKRKNEEREKEIRRREEGKLMLTAQEKAREREMREDGERKLKEKRESHEALKRLREQIKADREERQIINNRMKLKPSVEAPPVQQQQPTSTGNSARIQCRFANGTTLVHVFTPENILRDIVDLIDKDGRETGNFYLVLQYPRHEFTQFELTQTLLQLQLVPSAVIMVVPESGRVAPRPASTNGFISRLFNSISQNLRNVYDMLMSYLGFGRMHGRQAIVTDQRPNTSVHGNIHRFRAENQNDDEDATWNGNSTQQL